MEWNNMICVIIVNFYILNTCLPLAALSQIDKACLKLIKVNPNLILNYKMVT